MTAELDESNGRLLEARLSVMTVKLNNNAVTYLFPL